MVKIEIRNVTPEQIEQAMEEATKIYGGNLYLKTGSVKVTLPKAEQTSETRTYTARGRWQLFRQQEDLYDNDEGSIFGTGEMREWEEYGETPYLFYGERTEEEANAAEYQALEERIARHEKYPLTDDGGHVLRTEYEIRWVPEHEKTYTVQHKTKYVGGTAIPLNRKGTRYRVWIGVKSARRPGSRVSQERYGVLGLSNNKPKRIGSACWHAHRDFFREIFAINPDAEIHTALAKYKGEEDFEEKFPATAYSGGMALAALVQNIGDACNCDEGEHPEYAVEGLTEEQYKYRLPLWEDYPEYCHIPKPKREKALLAERSRGREEEGE